METEKGYVGAMPNHVYFDFCFLQWGRDEVEVLDSDTVWFRQWQARLRHDHRCTEQGLLSKQKERQNKKSKHVSQVIFTIREYIGLSVLIFKGDIQYILALKYLSSYSRATRMNHRAGERLELFDS